ncbi:hypothetical protein ABT039_18150 [Streptomyces lasiicapitis]|uniref:hypothetical protein n=1 Tax=Streptomyces lasiicapitis TaxID=1923961 RepID=UPI00331D70C3
MSSTIPPLAPAARAAYGAYATLRRQPRADELTDRLKAMHEYASERTTFPVWEMAAQHLDRATRAVASAQAASRTERKDQYRVAMTIVLSAILAFERAHEVTLPYDEHGRYHLKPGTEYPFSISDIARAAVQILGPNWEVEPLPWGVGGYIEEEREEQGYKLAVDADGELYLCDDARGGSRTYMDACAADGLPALAERVADLILSLHTTEG